MPPTPSPDIKPQLSAACGSGAGPTVNKEESEFLQQLEDLAIAKQCNDQAEHIFRSFQPGRHKHAAGLKEAAHLHTALALDPTLPRALALPVDEKVRAHLNALTQGGVSPSLRAKVNKTLTDLTAAANRYHEHTHVVLDRKRMAQVCKKTGHTPAHIIDGQVINLINESRIQEATRSKILTGCLPDHSTDETQSYFPKPEEDGPIRGTVREAVRDLLMAKGLQQCLPAENVPANSHILVQRMHAHASRALDPTLPPVPGSTYSKKVLDDVDQLTQNQGLALLSNHREWARKTGSLCSYQHTADTCLRVVADIQAKFAKASGAQRNQNFLSKQQAALAQLDSTTFKRLHQGLANLDVVTPKPVPFSLLETLPVPNTPLSAPQAPVPNTPVAVSGAPVRSWFYRWSPARIFGNRGSIDGISVATEARRSVGLSNALFDDATDIVLPPLPVGETAEAPTTVYWVSRGFGMVMGATPFTAWIGRGLYHICRTD